VNRTLNGNRALSDFVVGHWIEETCFKSEGYVGNWDFVCQILSYSFDINGWERNWIGENVLEI